MRCSTNQHQFYWGSDLHARSMDVCVLKHDGALLLHRTMPVAPDPLLQAIAPDREGLVVAVACLCTWDGLAALWAQEGMPFVRGPARSMQAIHGGTAKNDTIDSPKMAALLRGGMPPQADVSPAERRAPRDRRRRRTPLRHTRAAL
jgi:hypothetical protein